MPKRARTVALLSATGSVLLVALFVLIYREEIEAWLRGYRMIWMEEGVTPTSIGKLFGRNNCVAVNVVGDSLYGSSVRSHC